MITIDDPVRYNLPYIQIEYGDTFEEVKKLAEEKGAVKSMIGIDLYHIQYNHLPIYYTLEQLKALFPIPRV